MANLALFVCAALVSSILSYSFGIYKDVIYVVLVFTLINSTQFYYYTFKAVATLISFEYVPLSTLTIILNVTYGVGMYALFDLHPYIVMYMLPWLAIITLNNMLNVLITYGLVEVNKVNDDDEEEDE